MILMIDNYDSFTYNLYQYLGVLGVEVEVRRNDKISLGEIEAMRPEDLRREIADELENNLLPFWRERVPDDSCDGFIAEMDADGTVREDAPRGLILHSRLLWTFSALYRKFGDRRDLDLQHLARGGRDFDTPVCNGLAARHALANPDVLVRIVEHLGDRLPGQARIESADRAELAAHPDDAIGIVDEQHRLVKTREALEKPDCRQFRNGGRAGGARLHRLPTRHRGGETAS